MDSDKKPEKNRIWRLSREEGLAETAFIAAGASPPPEEDPEKIEKKRKEDAEAEADEASNEAYRIEHARRAQQAQFERDKEEALRELHGDDEEE